MLKISFFFSNYYLRYYIIYTLKYSRLREWKLIYIDPRVLLNVPRSSVCIIILSLSVYNNYYSIFRNKTLSHHCFLSTNNGFPTIIVLRRSVVNIYVATIEWLLSCPSVRLTQGIMVGPYLYIYAPTDYNLRVYGACIWMRLRFTTQRIDDHGYTAYLHRTTIKWHRCSPFSSKWA